MGRHDRSSSGGEAMSEPAKDEGELAVRMADTIWSGQGQRADVMEIALMLEAVAAIRKAGWAVVPAEPTEEIQDAIIHAMDDAGYITANEHEAAKIYRAAMIAAAPGVKP
jgi:hypothetical protein